MAPGLVTLPLQFAAQVMDANTGLHPDQTRWLVREPCFDLSARASVRGDRHRSFSASSRNSSGTEREAPSATDPYPAASHPKRPRIESTARSTTRRAMPFLVPGRRFSSRSRSGSSSCTTECFSRFDTEIASSEMVCSSG